MKKTLLFAALIIGGLTQLTAQCTIAPVCTTANVDGYCTTPATATPLPNASELTPYSTTIQVSVGTMAFGGAATISDATVTSITGLPAGLSYTLNPANGFMLGGTSGCLFISGIPSSGSAGNYTVTASIMANTNFGPFPVSGTWPLTVTGSTGVSNIGESTQFFISPNPATNELFVASASHFGKVVVMDALGKTVLSHDANYEAQTTINISSLSKGVYFLQVSDGTNLTTRKFIKE